MKYTVLIADDEIGIRELLKELLKNDYNILLAEDGNKTIKLLNEENPDVIILDIRMPKKNGIAVLEHIHKKNLKAIPIIISADKDVQTAINAMKLGAFDYIVKPFENEKIFNLIKNAIEKLSLKSEVEYLRTELKKQYSFKNIVGMSTEMEEVYKQINNILDNDAVVLITGESGTGKELIARAIHFNGKRKDYPFIPVDCASIPETLIESELFGHEKGAYTGAMNKKIGKFELSNFGTIFLDEIGNLKPEVQSKLLRILQEQEFSRVGGNEKIKVDVRIISATNADLLGLIKEKQFREDLFYRLNVVPINLPPLRERKGDIPLLTQHFLETFNKKFNKKIKILKDAVDSFNQYNWPGNVRELENTIQRMILTCPTDTITSNNLPENILHSEETSGLTGFQTGITLDENEKIVIKKTLIANNMNISKTAKVLGVTRKTLHNKLDKYNDLKKLIKKKKSS
ncbi:MAG: sigma-54 dependent transcriptional regulator [Spirochaetes bacterium]|nr:sigma-54 dependent transcriptional regulator [Spirochaetota bacterium]